MKNDLAGILEENEEGYSFSYGKALYESSREGLMIGKWAAEQQFLKKSIREIAWLTETAEERYLSLLSNHPDSAKTFP